MTEAVVFNPLRFNSIIFAPPPYSDDTNSRLPAPKSGDVTAIE